MQGFGPKMAPDKYSILFTPIRAKFVQLAYAVVLPLDTARHAISNAEIQR